VEDLERETDRLKLREEEMLSQAQACIEGDEEAQRGYALLRRVPGVGRLPLQC